MSLGSRLLRFFLSDVIWVIAGQLVALFVGLASLKIYTSIFSAEQYAYLALFMATSGWIWLGLYQALNQAVFRFGSTAKSPAQKQIFLEIWQQQHRLLSIICLIMSGLVCAISTGMRQWDYFFLILAATVLGMVSGQIHGYVSYYLSLRLRRPVTWIQSMDGISRLMGGLACYAMFEKTALSVAIGIAIGAAFLLWIIKKSTSIPRYPSKILVINVSDSRVIEFKRYMYKMFFLMVLNACIINLDKWLILPLIGSTSLGIYAIIQTLAITTTTVMYSVFEMLFFPLIFKAQNVRLRRQQMRMMIISFTTVLLVVGTVCWLWGHWILLWLANEQTSAYSELFTLLVAGSGIFQMARLMMAEAQFANMPHRHWPSYLVFVLIFVAWSLLMLEPGSLLQVGQGFTIAAIGFWISTIFINKHQL
jgi:O-antigen/teichoic acid export membrane protein